MIELIGIIACLIVCIVTPIQTAKVRSGQVPAKFKGTPAEYRAAYVKQLSLLIWVGLGFGCLMLVLAVIPNDTPYEWVVKLISAGLWFALGGICFFSRSSIETAAPVPTAQ